jgi:DtxR family Mn-dependent transcriptional regulator
MGSMSKKRERDEYLEQLWYMKEEGKNSIDALKGTLDTDYDVNITNELLSDGLVDLSEAKGRISLTKKGQDYAQQLIRAHRLAERLLHNVLGGDYESGACEFEHTVTPELVDSICILLGHPRECPHGMPIPEGQCCRRSSTTAQSSVIPLVELAVGQSARVAYINCKSDQQLHKIDSLCIRPGTVITLHQRYPTYVIECEDSNIAMDEEIVSNICVWRQPEHVQEAGKEALAQPDTRDSGRDKFRHRKKGES